MFLTVTLIAPLIGLTLELHFSVGRYTGLRLPFRGITEYLHGLVSYECPIIAGVRVLIVYSTYVQ